MRVEWLKLKGYRPFWLIVGSYPLVLLVSTFLLMRVERYIHDQVARKSVAAAMMVGRSPFVFPEVWQTLTYLASWFHVIPALLIMLTVSNEFQFRTHRQNLLDGWSRAAFFRAKATLVGLLSLAVTLCVGLLALLVGFARGSFEWGNLHYLGYFFVQSLSYGMFSLMLAFVFRRGLLALAFFLLYSKILEKFAGWMVGRLALSLSYCTPLGCADDLIPFPLQTVRRATQKLSEGMPPTSILLACAVGWLGVYLIVSWRLFRRQDL